MGANIFIILLKRKTKSTFTSCYVDCYSEVPGKSARKAIMRRKLIEKNFEGDLSCESNINLLKPLGLCLLLVQMRIEYRNDVIMSRKT